MAFIDELTIEAKAGHGGNGVVRWLHEKGKEFMGPSGGNGGRGGNVYAIGVRNAHLLNRYKTDKKFKAKRGGDGEGNSRQGARGEDLIIELPVGSIITDLRSDKKYRLDKEGQKELLLKGGDGGLGNEHFKGSTNQTPKEWTPGKPGEESEFYIEVELIADIGLIGLPNAGKTSLLNELTAAEGKVGDYPFTTLEPNLGERNGFIFADVPGLIEGASGGKGLGHKFLRHIKRTKLLAHLVSLENEDPVKAYMAVRKELEDYDKELGEKPEVIVLTKTDVCHDSKQVQKVVEKMKKLNTKVFALTLLNNEEIKNLGDYLTKELQRIR